RGGIEAVGLDGPAVGDVHVHGRTDDAIGVDVERERADRAAVVDVDVAVVGPGEDAGRRVGIAVGVDVAAVADRGAALAGTGEDAHGLAVDAGVDRAGVRDVDVALDGRGQDAPATARTLRIDRTDRAAVGDVHVARAGVGADAVGTPRADADVAAVGDRDAVHAAAHDAGADGRGGHVDRTGVVDERTAVLRGGDDAAGRVVKERRGLDADVAGVGDAGVAIERQRHDAFGQAAGVHVDQARVVDAGVAVGG